MLGDSFSLTSLPAAYGARDRTVRRGNPWFLLAIHGSWKTVHIYFAKIYKEAKTRQSNTANFQIAHTRSWGIKLRSESFTEQIPDVEANVWFHGNLWRLLDMDELGF